MAAAARMLPDGKRLHLQEGPIDLVIEAWGPAEEMRAAYRQAASCFGEVLSGLVRELPALRQALGSECPQLTGPVANRMVEACWPYRGVFVTPMAAVAGAVADHVLAAMVEGRRLAKAYVNDGGDIALHLTPGASLACGLVADLRAPRLDGAVTVDAAMPVRGIATSGAATKGSGGRSFSLGIADAVTVLAASAAAADAAATMIANAVDLPSHPGIRREPASAIDPDSDLGERAVTITVPPLSPDEIDRALAAGQRRAAALVEAGLIAGAVLALQGRFASAGAPVSIPSPQRGEGYGERAV